MSPRFDFIPGKDLPIWKENNLNFKLIAGAGYKRTSPLPVHSDLFMIEVSCTEVSELNIGSNLRGELGLLIVSGTVSCELETIDAGNMIVTENAENTSFSLSKNAHVLLFGGIPFPEERFLFWNFCSSSKECLEPAKEDWDKKRFPQVYGDNSYIALP